MVLYTQAAAGLLWGSISLAEPVSSHFTTSDGVDIHYLTDGDQGSPVVLVHGFTSSAQGNWYNTEIAQTLAQNHRVIAIDMRNHGESELTNFTNFILPGYHHMNAMRPGRGYAESLAFLLKQNDTE
jgi:pimeloyl-ACP methyl ester carboxylesterase